MLAYFTGQQGIFAYSVQNFHFQASNFQKAFFAYTLKTLDTFGNC